MARSNQRIFIAGAKLFVSIALVAFVGAVQAASEKATPLYSWVQEKLDHHNEVMQENLAGVRVVFLAWVAVRPAFWSKPTRSSGTRKSFFIRGVESHQRQFRTTRHSHYRGWERDASTEVAGGSLPRD